MTRQTDGPQPLRKRSFLRRMVNGFARDERGSIAVEAVLILPMMFWVYLAIFSSFHAYRTYTVNQKAAYTIGDMVSRETNPIDDDYLAGTRSLLTYLTAAPLADVSVRLTSVRYDAAADQYEREWSQAEGFMDAATAGDVRSWAAELPTLPDGERVMVVETRHKYEPPFDVGFNERDVDNFVFTRPRYAPCVLWHTGTLSC